MHLSQGGGQRLWLAGERSADGSSAPLQFDFDAILAPDIQQQQVYEMVARPLVDAATAGYSACLMCYGQTGTGKTYTFGGGDLLKAFRSSGSSSKSKDPPPPPAPPPAEKQSNGRRGKQHEAAQVPTGADAAKEAKREADREEKARRDELRDQRARQGVVGRALRHILDWAGPRNMVVCFSYVQVYMELLQDLLRPESSLTLREHPDLGVYVDGACWRTIKNVESACAQVAEADARRTTAFTKLNADSSRSHAVLLVAIRSAAEVEATAASASAAAAAAELPLMSARYATTARQPPAPDFEWASAKGRLFLVDLAGSERTKRSGAVGQNFEEACSINQSLTTLGRCIQALAGKGGSKKDSRAPVRESKLTRLLSPCLGGSTTSLVCCVSNAAADRYETQSTLEFGRNAMRVVLKPQSQMGVDYKALTIQLQAQLDEKVQTSHELEASIYAKLHAEYAGRLRELEQGRREAEVAKQRAEIAYDKREGAQKTAEAAAAAAVADLRDLQSKSETHVKTSRASHDSRAAIIATADSLAEEVVRARRDRDEAIMQLELLSSQMGRPAHASAVGGSGAAGGTTGSERGGGVPGFEVPEGASAVERECGFAAAEIAGYRTHLEKRKMRARAATAKAGMPSLGGASSSRGGSEEQRALADRKALQSMRMSISSSLGSMGELLASVVELCETQHPELWQGNAEQLLLTEQLRASQRLVHMLGNIQQDFAGIAGPQAGGV